MRSNKYAGSCAGCGTPVPAQAGTLTGRPRRWQTWCSACAPVAPPHGTHTGWFDAPLAVLDFETTGTDPRSDRIISYACLGTSADSEQCGLIDPGVPISPSAIAVHGIGPDQLEGAPPTRNAIGGVIEWLNELIAAGTGLVVFNAPYDLTMLCAEAGRTGVPQPDWDRLMVVDPLVIDWGIYRGELGPRKLTDVCLFYDVALADAHDARADAHAARDIAVEMGRRHEEVGSVGLAELVDRQRQWFAERAEDWNTYARRVGRGLDDPRGWPLLPVRDSYDRIAQANT